MKFHRSAIYLLISVLFLFFSCKDDPFELPEDQINPRISGENKIKPVIVVPVQNEVKFKTVWEKLNSPELVAEFGFAWSRSSNPDPRRDAEWSTTQTPSLEDSIIHPVRDLIDGEKYHVVAYLREKNVDSIAISSVVEFIYDADPIGTSEIDITIGGNDLSSVKVLTIGAESATVSARWIAINTNDPITNFGFIWSTNNDPRFNVDPTYDFGNNPAGATEFSHIIQGLDPFTDYYVRTFAKTSSRPSPELGEVLPFKTTGYPPEIETGATISKDTDRATVEATIILSGSTDITEYGHVWSTDSRPGINTALKSVYSGPVSDNFTYQTEITGLQNGVIYYYRAYAQNNDTLRYGQIRNFRTESLPSLQVASINIIAESLEQDQKVNRGETVSYELRIRNTGSKVATGVRVVLSSNSPDISSISNHVDLGAIAGNSSVEKIAIFDVSVDPFADWDSTIRLDITLTDDQGAEWTDDFSFTIESQFIVTNGLLAYFTFDRDDSTTTKINSEINNDLYFGFRYNNPSFSSDIPGLGGSSLRFTEANSTYAELGRNPFYGKSEGTFNLWIKTVDADGVLVSETSPKRTYIRLVNNSIYFSQFECGARNYSFYKSFGIDNQEIRDNNWHMLTVSIKNGEQKIFYDGLHRRTVNNFINTNSGLCDDLYYGLNPLSNNNGYSFGAYHPTGSGSLHNLYTGYLDNIRFYDRILSDAEVLQLFNAKQ